MVGAEIWKTGEGVITNGSKEAREAILNIYQDPQSGFQQVLEECSLTAAKTQDQSPQNNLFEYSVIRGLLTLAFDSSDAVFFTMPLYLTATYLISSFFFLSARFFCLFHPGGPSLPKARHQLNQTNTVVVIEN